MTDIIPVIHCFDDNYVIPAGVAFLSMLEHADPKCFYRLYVLHNNITPENQEKLKSIVGAFENASLEFVFMNQKFDDLFKNTSMKAHYSKEMYYKLIIPSLFPQYDYAIITDVDVLYQGDIAPEFKRFTSDTKNYIAGVSYSELKDPWLNQYKDTYKEQFSADEIEKLLIGAGYMIFNLAKMREDKMEEKFLHYATENAFRIKQPEQDTLNLCCYPHIKLLPLSSMVCSYLYDLNLDEKAFQNPVQLHYATHIKPWNTPDCTMAHLWYQYLTRTPFFYQQMKRFAHPCKKEYWCLGPLPLVTIKYLVNNTKHVRFMHLFKLRPKKRKS